MRGAGLATIAALSLIVFAAAEVATPSAAEPKLDCGPAHTASAKFNPNPGGRPPIAIGESTMLLPIYKIANKGFDVNARGCRNVGEGVKLIRSIRKDGKLPHLVVVYLGVSGRMSVAKINQMLKLLGHSRVLGLVTGIHGPTETRLPGTRAIRTAKRKHKHKIAVLDWYKHSRGHPDWFVQDHYHPSFKGAGAFAKYMVHLRKFAKKGAFPG